jgi:hydroxymethylbilane synthase
MPLRLGTRGSALARWQAEWVSARLRERGVEVELTPIVTTGDRQHEELRIIGGEGVFTKEIQRALLDGRIDLAVHSLKDLPTEAAPGLALAAVPERGPVCDVLALPNIKPRPAVATAGGGFMLDEETLQLGARIGTGSLRRRAQLLHVRPDLQISGIRGNVETRLGKLERGDFDALVLAEAGLRRLGLERCISQVLPPRLVMPAVGQGALGLETRSDDTTTRQIVEALDHPPTHAAVLAERAMLAALRGGCLAPIAAMACVEGGHLTLTGRVIGHDGVELLEAADSLPHMRPASNATQLGRQVAEALLGQGAERLIAASRSA